MKRRDFLKKSAIFSSAMLLPSLEAIQASEKSSWVTKVKGDSPYAITRMAIEKLGGMKKFVSKQDVVMIKPNIAWNRTVEHAACTNPEVLKALVEMAFNAGAKKVIVMDHTCHQALDTYRRSGIEEMVKKVGAEVRHADENRLVTHDFKGERVKTWPVYKDFLEVDTFINVPILKHHSSSGLTIGMKNLFGIIGGRRGKLHRDIGTCIADLAHGFKVDLTVVDAYRILRRNGPIGGSLNDVELTKTVIASPNIMEADMVAIDLFGAPPEDISFVRPAFERKMGPMDITQINIKTYTA